METIFFWVFCLFLEFVYFGFWRWFVYVRVYVCFDGFVYRGVLGSSSRCYFNRGVGRVLVYSFMVLGSFRYFCFWGFF